MNIPTNINVVTNDTDADGSINVATVDLDPLTPGIQNTFPTTGGTFAVDGAGVVGFMPTTGFIGTANVNYTVNDNLGLVSNVGVITVTVQAGLNTPPNAVNDATTTVENTPVSFNVLTNDVDTDGTINMASVDIDQTLVGIQNTFSNGNGSYSVSNTGVVTFIPNTGFTGSSVLTYTVNDDLSQTSNFATLTITVIVAGNIAPVSVNDGLTTNNILNLNVNVLTNDSDSDGSLDLTSVDIDQTQAGIQNTFTNSAGTWTVNTLGVVTLVPVNGFNGIAVLEYTVNDNQGSTSNVSTLSIAISGINALNELVNFYSIYPNPCQSTLKIQTENTFKKVTIYSLLGEKLIETSENVINIDALVNSIYFINIEFTTGEIVSSQIVKN
jgi:hypothetical protein